MLNLVRFRFVMLLTVGAMLLSSCYTTVVTTPGPPGLPGRAFFGISWDQAPPYSYWDNNASLPYNPPFDMHFETAPGIYQFEYFINPVEYWYGTYEVWVNPGQPGCDCGEPGLNGMDNYFTLVCDPHGFYETVWASYKNGNTDGELVLEKEDGPMNMRVTLKKANVNERPAQAPKWTSAGKDVARAN